MSSYNVRRCTQAQQPSQTAMNLEDAKRYINSGIMRMTINTAKHTNMWLYSEFVSCIHKEYYALEDLRTQCTHIALCIRICFKSVGS